MKTQFGWHIIQVEDKRDKPAPPFDQVKAQIEHYLARKSQAERMTQLRAGRQDRESPRRHRRRRRRRPPRRRPRRQNRRSRTEPPPRRIFRLRPMPAVAPGIACLRRRWRTGIDSCPPPFRRSPPACSRHAAVAGVRLATAAAGINYQGRTDVLLALLDRHGGRRRSHPLEMPLGPGRLVPRTAQGRQGARAGGQFRQRQRFHRQDRPRGGEVPPPCRQAAAASPRGFPASTGVIGEPLQAEHFTACWTPRRRRRAGRLARGRRGDHDHRHLSEGRDRDRADRRPPSPSTASPRAPA